MQSTMLEWYYRIAVIWIRTGSHWNAQSICFETLWRVKQAEEREEEMQLRNLIKLIDNVIAYHMQYL